jgi:hypothetical protein
MNKSYLGGLITVLPIKHRRPRKSESVAKLHNASFSYRVRVVNESETKGVVLCFKALFEPSWYRKKD